MLMLVPCLSMLGIGTRKYLTLFFLILLIKAIEMIKFIAILRTPYLLCNVSATVTLAKYKSTLGLSATDTVPLCEK